MSGPRVVVLARMGAARDRTEVAVREAGAELVATLDPADATEADVRAVAPVAVVVVLDPVAEFALDKFDALLADPGLDIVFDEADVAAKRDGWEAARWARHLAAKLHGHGDVLPAAPKREVPRNFSQEMEALALKVAALPDVPQAPSHPATLVTGAVVIAAGVGGPDAVRQLLACLPAGFPRPILLRQRVDGGQYDKLVRQMQRATLMQVVLAQPGDVAQPGTVHVLQDGLDVQQAEDAVVFVAAAGEPRFSSLRPGDSAVLLLSGADPALVDVALTVRLGGGLGYGQAPENCFDPAASNALVARGGESRSLAELSRQLLQRWSA